MNQVKEESLKKVIGGKRESGGPEVSWSSAETELKKIYPSIENDNKLKRDADLILQVISNRSLLGTNPVDVSNACDRLMEHPSVSANSALCNHLNNIKEIAYYI